MDDFWPRLEKALGEEIEPVSEFHTWYRGAEAQLPWLEGRRYELIPIAEPLEPIKCVSENGTLRIMLPMSRRHTWNDLVSVEFREKMKIVEVLSPPVTVIYQTFSL
jgi:hypothetical protein